MNSYLAVHGHIFIDVEVSDIEVSQPCTDKEEIVLNCVEHLDL